MGSISRKLRKILSDDEKERLRRQHQDLKSYHNLSRESRDDELKNFVKRMDNNTNQALIEIKEMLSENGRDDELWDLLLQPLESGINDACSDIQKISTSLTHDHQRILEELHEASRWLVHHNNVRRVICEMRRAKLQLSFLTRSWYHAIVDCQSPPLNTAIRMNASGGLSIIAHRQLEKLVRYCKWLDSVQPPKVAKIELSGAPLASIHAVRFDEKGGVTSSQLHTCDIGCLFNNSNKEVYSPVIDTHF